VFGVVRTLELRIASYQPDPVCMFPTEDDRSHASELATLTMRFARLTDRADGLSAYDPKLPYTRENKPSATSGVGRRPRSCA
jgi:hypothetical protein